MKFSFVLVAISVFLSNWALSGVTFAASTPTAPKAVGNWVSWDLVEQTKADLTVRLGGRSVSLKMEKQPGDEDHVLIHVRVKGTTIEERILLEEYPFRGDATLVNLSAEDKFPHLVVSFYSGGAHCCFQYRLFSLKGQKWKEIPFGKKSPPTGSGDGDGTDALQDINGDGIAELVERDDSFLYKFASYAGSYSPSRVYALAGGKWVDVSSSAGFRQRYGYKDADLRKECGSGSNSFWATYVAEQAIVGQMGPAWERMLKCYNKTDDWGLCKSPDEMSECKSGVRPFPTVLEQHLKETGYWSRTEGTQLSNDCRAFPMPLDNGKMGLRWGPRCSPEQCKSRKCLGY